MDMREYEIPNVLPASSDKEKCWKVFYFILFKKKEMTTEERKVNSHFHDEEKGHQIKKMLGY